MALVPGGAVSRPAPCISRPNRTRKSDNLCHYTSLKSRHAFRNLAAKTTARLPNSQSTAESLQPAPQPRQTPSAPQKSPTNSLESIHRHTSTPTPSASGYDPLRASRQAYTKPTRPSLLPRLADSQLDSSIRLQHRRVGPRSFHLLRRERACPPDRFGGAHVT